MADKGTIKLLLDKPYYVAGERVAGTVNIDLMMPVQASAVKIKWTGYERTVIQYTIVETGTTNEEGETETEAKVETVRVEDENTFFKNEAVLYQINQVIPAGHYNYPFSFQLPASLPGIFFYHRKCADEVKAAIVYKVKVFLDVPGKDLKCSQKIVISEAVCRAMTPLHDKKKKRFLLATGKLKMEYWLEKNVFCPDEVVPIKVKVDNESSKKVNHIKAKLMRDLKVKAKGETRTLTEEVSRDTFEGVDKKSELEKVFNFKLPNVFPSANGKLVQCNYHLDIECDVPMAFDLEHHVPVTIALMPSAPMAIDLYASYTPHGW
eukprot:m51a1_g8138 hypothetical protein (321) ;mRNA; f:16554-18062